MIAPDQLMSNARAVLRRVKSRFFLAAAPAQVVQHVHEVDIGVVG